ncbi:8119_t:CDS:1 [Ambispora gerdemannii]|uniref:8119_t:CDS:1 n=1 Tax=Ambispora gerdemannii TaxID=144530 RepID=A0A9N8UYR4_9GLOM|nr:8119_t:CDS:1 [Ambispora gerdemannii]
MYSSNGSDILRPAATIVIVAPIKKIDDEIEYNDKFNYKVLMMKRNAKGSFVNAHVFPGGNVDPSDSSKEWSSANLTPEFEFTKIMERDQSSTTSLTTSKICAIRETFEECGILLTKPNVKFDLTEAKRWRDKIHNDANEFISLCKKFKLKPAIEELDLFYNWITPRTELKRYNVNFYLTIIPYDDVSYTDIVADGEETTQLNWFTPEEALTAFRKSEINLFPPQWYTLTELFEYKKLFQLRVMLNSKKRIVVPMMPEFMKDDKTNRRYFVLPGDFQHSTTPDHVRKTNPNARHRFYFDFKKKTILNLEMNIGYGNANKSRL